MGAEVVVAVDVSSDKFDPEKLKSFGGVLSRTISLPIRQNVAKALPRASVVVRPRVADLPSMDFARAADLVARGEDGRAGRREGASASPSPEEEYRAFRERVRGRRPESPVVDAIQTVSAGVDTRQITSRLETRAGSPLDVAVLRRDLDRIYEMGVFETVDFRLLRDEGRNVLLIDARPKSWGPTFLRVGSAFEANFDGNATLALRATLHAMQLNGRGGELKTTLELGTVPGVHVEYYQPLDFRGRFFVSADVLVPRSLASVIVTGRPRRGGEGRATPGVGRRRGFARVVRAGPRRRLPRDGDRRSAGDEAPARRPEHRPRWRLWLRRVRHARRPQLPSPGDLAGARLEAFLDDLGSETTFYRLFAASRRCRSVRGRPCSARRLGGHARQRPALLHALHARRLQPVLRPLPRDRRRRAGGVALGVALPPDREPPDAHRPRRLRRGNVRAGARLDEEGGDEPLGPRAPPGGSTPGPTPSSGRSTPGSASATAGTRASTSSSAGRSEMRKGRDLRPCPELSASTPERKEPQSYCAAW